MQNSHSGNQNVVPSRRAHSTHVSLCARSVSKERFSFVFLMRKMLFHCHIWLQFRTSLAPFTPHGQKSHFPAAHFPRQTYAATSPLCVLSLGCNYNEPAGAMNWLDLIKSTCSDWHLAGARTKSRAAEMKKSTRKKDGV